MKKFLTGRKGAASTHTKLAKVQPQGGALQLSKKKAGVFTTLVVATNFITYALFTPGMFMATSSSSSSNQQDELLSLIHISEPTIPY